MSSMTSAVLAVLRWKPVRWTLLSLVGVVLAAIATLYGASSWRLSETYERPTIVLRSTGHVSAERGERLAAMLSCKGCHGAHGRVFLDAPNVAHLIAPDLARVAATYSDDELAVLIRAGIKRDNTSLLIMPAGSFSSLADSELADVIAWLRALKPEAETETGETSFGPIGRFILLSGPWFSAAAPRDPAPPVVVPTETQAHGNYLFKTACTHCHKLDEERELAPGEFAPPLRAMAQGYDLTQFTHLLRTGKAIGDRELGLMSRVARSGYSRLTDEEIAAIHAYLNAPVEPAASDAATSKKPTGEATGQ